MTDRVLITCLQMQNELDSHRVRLEAAGYEVVAPVLQGQQFSAAELAPMMSGVSGMIAGDDELSAEFFQASPDLRVLVRWGIGMDSVDHQEAARRSVTVRNTPGVFGGEVADSAIAYVLLLARGHHVVDQAVRAGDWPKREGTSLSGSSMAVVGLGDIGRAVASRALGFGMRVVAFDPYMDAATAPAGVELTSDLGLALSSSRFVVLTCPLTPETHHLMNSRAFSLMRPDAYLVNVARGAVVDERALERALADRTIAGAGLDVFEIEPLPMASPLRSMPNVVLGAHNGSNTREGVARASSRAVDILLEELGRS